MHRPSMWTQVLLTVALVIPGCAQPAAPTAPNGDFQTYWSEFRAAVKSPEKITRLTHFPFEVKGVSDNDPLVSLSKDAFLKNLNLLLNQDTGLTKKGETMAALIERSAELKGKEIQPGANSTRVANFVFRKVNGTWRFARAYVEEPIKQ